MLLVLPSSQFSPESMTPSPHEEAVELQDVIYSKYLPAVAESVQLYVIVQVWLGVKLLKVLIVLPDVVGLKVEPGVQPVIRLLPLS